MTLIRVCRELILPHPRSELIPPQTIYREKTSPGDLFHRSSDLVFNTIYLKVSLWMSSSLLLKYWST